MYNIRIKKIFFSLIISIIFFAMTLKSQENGWFWINPTPLGTRLNDIHGFDEHTAIAVGDFGIVTKTDNGGIDWDTKSISSDYSGILRKMSFVNNYNGWVVADGGIIFKTIDGGSTWQRLQTAYSIDFAGIKFVNDSSGWLCGEKAILKTSNGGINWQATYFDSILYFQDIFFINENVGWVVGVNLSISNELKGILFKTVDGGLSWQKELDSINHLYEKIKFFNDSLGFILPGLKSTDGGQTWFVEAIVENASDIQFVDVMNGFIIYNNGLFGITTDGGVTWEIKNVGLSSDNFVLSFIDSFIGWIINKSEPPKIMKTTNGGSTWQNYVITATNEWLLSTLFQDHNIGWVIGDKGTILKTTDGGNSWISQKTNVNQMLWSIDIVDNDIGWVVGDNGKILKTINGGDTWFEQQSGTNLRLECVDFVNSNVGWIVGGYTGPGTILKTTNGGYTWVTQFSDQKFWLLFTKFLNQDMGWVVGANGKILKTTNGGLTWEEQDSGISNWLLALDILNQDTLVAVGFQGTIIKTTNGGRNWINVSKSSYGNFESVKFLDSNVGYAVGNDGSIVKTSDGGMNWAYLKKVSSNGLYYVDFVDQTTGWAVGENGTIIKTTTGGITSDNDNISLNIPLTFSLEQNFPNPFNPNTIINYHISRKSHVNLKVFNLIGQELETIVDDVQVPGIHSVSFMGNNLASGVYFYRIVINHGEYAQTKKFLLLR